MTGTKFFAEAVATSYRWCRVEERSAQGEAKRVSRGGQGGSENVSLSNVNIGENPVPRKLKGSCARLVRAGSVRT